jgi:alpha-1,6-mannosyltransferase
MLSASSPPSPLAPPTHDTLRVLDVTKFYAPKGGGVRTYLDAKIADFRERPIHHVLVIPGPRRHLGRRGNTRVYRVPGITIPFTPGYRFLLGVQTLREIIERERPQVVEVGSPFFVPLVTRWATQGWRLSTVGFYHADLVRTYVDPYVRRFPAILQDRIRAGTSAYVRRVYSAFDVTVAPSESVAKELKSVGIDDVETIPLGVDLELFRPDNRSPHLRRRLRVPEAKPIALFAGRLCPEKALDVVVDAQGLMDPATRPHLLFVGEGPSLPSLREAARQRSDLTVLQYVSDRRDLARIYASADIYLAAGPGETFGLAVAEAMASGLPVVGVDSGAVPDRLAGSGAGELYARGDPGSAVRAMGRITRRLGPEIRGAARDHAVREFGWKRTFDALTELYLNLAQGRSES